MKFDLNRISLIGMILGLGAFLLIVLKWTADLEWGVGDILGRDVSYAEIPLVWIVGLVAVVTYMIGRMIQVFRDATRSPDRWR
jgi:hypothetical protein